MAATERHRLKNLIAAHPGISVGVVLGLLTAGGIGLHETAPSLEQQPLMPLITSDYLHKQTLLNYFFTQLTGEEMMRYKTELTIYPDPAIDFINSPQKQSILFFPDAFPQLVVSGFDQEIIPSRIGVRIFDTPLSQGSPVSFTYGIEACCIQWGTQQTIGEFLDKPYFSYFSIKNSDTKKSITFARYWANYTNGMATAYNSNQNINFLIFAHPEGIIVDSKVHGSTDETLSVLEIFKGYIHSFSNQVTATDQAYALATDLVPYVMSAE